MIAAITQPPKKRRRKKGSGGKRSKGIFGLSLPSKAALTVKKEKSFLETLKNGFVPQTLNVAGLALGFVCGSVLNGVSKRVIVPDANEDTQVTGKGLLRAGLVMSAGVLLKGYQGEGMVGAVADGMAMFGGLSAFKIVSGKNLLQGVDGAGEEIIQGLGFAPIEDIAGVSGMGTLASYNQGYNDVLASAFRPIEAPYEPSYVAGPDEPIFGAFDEILPVSGPYDDIQGIEYADVVM